MGDRVLVTYGGYELEHPECGGALAGAGLELDVHPRASDRAPAELLDLLGDAVAAVADADPFDASVLGAAPRLRIVARTGVGLDAVDLEAATAAGVLVTITPGTNHEAVADHALALMLAVLRRLLPEHRRVAAGGWRDFSSPLGQLHGRTVGVIGFGAIGRAVGRRVAGFGAELLVHDPWAADVPTVGLEELLARSDVVSLHLPLSEATAHVIDAAALARMKPGAVVVNTARGGLVDQAALLEALRAGRLGGAGLDVHEIEPPGRSALAELDGVVLTPHVGGISDASNLAMSRMATASVLGALRGEAVGEVANPEVLERGPWRRPR